MRIARKGHLRRLSAGAPPEHNAFVRTKLEKALGGRGVVRREVVQYLERDIGVQDRVVCPVDLGEAAGPQQFSDLVHAEGAPGQVVGTCGKGDVVGIKVCPVGGPNRCSVAIVLRNVLDGLKEAGVPASDIIVFNRYGTEVIETGIDKWLPPGIRWTAASPKMTELQQDMEGYDADHYMDMALVLPGQSLSNEHARRSYVARVVTQQVNKFINLPV